MQDFPLHGVYIETLSTNNIEMKTMTVDCDIRSLTSTQMIWNKPGTNEDISRFKKVK